MSDFPSLVKGERLKIACVCFVGSNPTSDNLRPLIVKEANADLAQVAFGQTQTFNLGTRLEHPVDWRSHFHGKVPGSSPGVGTTLY